MKLDELAALERAATAPPWQEFAESGDWWVAGVDADGGPLGSICNSDVGDRGTWARQEDVDLMVAMRNSYRGLLRVALAAANDERLCDRMADLLLARSCGDADVEDAADEELESMDEQYRAARAELRAALRAMGEELRDD